MTLMINRVLEGPMHIFDMPANEWPPYEVIDNNQHWLLEVEVGDGEIKEDVTMTIRDFDLAYGIEKHFKEGGSPIEVREDCSLWSDDELMWDDE